MPRIVLMLIVLLLFAERAAGQPSPWQPETRTTGGWVFTPGLSAGLAWDSGLESSGNPFVESLIHKWVGRVNPRAEIDFNSRRSRLNAGYSGALEKYRGTESGFEQYGTVNASHTFDPRFTTSASAGYSATPTTDRLFVTNGSVPYAEVHSKWVDATGGFRWQTGPRTNVKGGYRFSRLTFDHDDSLGRLETLREGYTHAPYLTALHSLTARLTVGGTAEYRREIIEDGPTFDLQTGTGEFVYRLGSDTTLSGGAGASLLQVRDYGMQNIEPTYHGGVEHRVRRLSLGGSYEHAYRPVFGVGTVAMTDTILGRVSTPLFDRLYYLSGDVSYSRSDPVEAIGFGFDFATLWLNASVGRRLATWLSAEGYVSVTRQDSDRQGNTARTRVGVQFVTSKPMRIQ